MKCKNKELHIEGILDNGKYPKSEKFMIVISNDDKGKTISIAPNDGNSFPHFHIPAELISFYLKGEYNK